MTAALIVAVAIAAGEPTDANVAHRVSQIFQAVETGTPPGEPRAAIQQRLTALAPSTDDDHRLRYAYTVALVHEKRYPDALCEATTLVAAEPNSLPGHRIRVWLLLTQKKYTEALVSLEAPARLIPPQESDGEPELINIEVSQFLGTVIGFLEMVKEPMLTQFKGRIVARFGGGKRQEAFDQQVKAVAKLYEDIRHNDEEAFARVDKKRQESVQVVQKKEAHAEKTAQQLRDEWKRLEKQWSQLREIYVQLARQAGMLQSARADATRDIGKLDVQLSSVTQALEETVQRGAMIEYQANQLAVAGQNLGEGFALQKPLFDKDAKALAGKEARIKKRGPRAPMIRQEAYVFATYDNFSYEREKQRILDSLTSQ